MIPSGIARAMALLFAAFAFVVVIGVAAVVFVLVQIARFLARL